MSVIYDSSAIETVSAAEEDYDDVYSYNEDYTKSRYE
jgi:hypothetical protein